MKMALSKIGEMRRRRVVMYGLFKTVQIEIRLSEYGGNKKAVRTDGLLANYQN